MKTTPLIIGIVLVVAVVLGFVLVGKDSATDATPNTAENTDTQDTSTPAEEGVFTGSIMELAKRGGNFICTFSHSSAVANSTGTVYVSGSDIRGDFKSVAQGINVESHMIQKDGYVYTWSPIAPTGFKIKTVASEGDGDASMSDQYKDLNQAYSYDCKSWSRDASKFTLPNISFTEINS